MPLPPISIEPSFQSIQDGQCATESDVASDTPPIPVARYSHLPFEIPGAVELSNPSVPELQDHARGVFNQLTSGTSHANQVIVVSHVPRSLQILLDGDRNAHGFPYRVTYDVHRQQAVLRIMPLGAHEPLTAHFTADLVLKLDAMGIGTDDCTWNGTTTYEGSMCGKQLDQSFTPSSNPTWHCPSQVVETSLSESTAHLGMVAHEWLVNSVYTVNTVAKCLY